MSLRVILIQTTTSINSLADEEEGEVGQKKRPPGHLYSTAFPQSAGSFLASFLLGEEALPQKLLEAGF